MSVQTQYHIRRDLFHFINKHFYGEQLSCNFDEALPWDPFVFYQTEGEEQTDDTGSFENPQEAEAVLKTAVALLNADPSLSLHLLTPYSCQKRLLASHIDSFPIKHRYLRVATLSEQVRF